MDTRATQHQAGRKTVIWKTVLVCASLAILATGLFPPWLYTCYQTGTKDSPGVRSEHNAGYHVIFAPPAPEYVGWPASGVRLDVGRLLVEWMCILTGAGMICGVATFGEGRPHDKPKRFRDFLAPESEKLPKRNGNSHK
jgi:hypothetical protein